MRKIVRDSREASLQERASAGPHLTERHSRLFFVRGHAQQDSVPEGKPQAYFMTLPTLRYVANLFSPLFWIGSCFSMFGLCLAFIAIGLPNRDIARGSPPVSKRVGCALCLAPTFT